MVWLNDCAAAPWDRLSTEEAGDLAFWACLFGVEQELVRYSVGVAGPSAWSVARHLRYILAGAGEVRH